MDYEKECIVPEDSAMFQHIDKEVFDNADHTSRYMGEEKLNTYVFGNSDGTKTIYYMDENVKFVDEHGVIRDKDISLIKEEEGYGIVENEVDLFLSDTPNDGVDVEFSGYSVKLIPQGGDDTVVARQDNDAIIYDAYFDENTSLKYTPLLSGVKEDIILAEYAENVSYDFVIETDGLYIYNDEKGYYLADELNTKIVFYLGDVIVYDGWRLKRLMKECSMQLRFLTLKQVQALLLTHLSLKIILQRIMRAINIIWRRLSEMDNSIIR